MKKGNSLLFLLGIFLLILTVAFTGFKFWQKSSLEKDLVALESKIKSAEKTLDEADAQNVQGLIAAKRTLNQMKEEEVNWSEVLKEIRRTLPTNLDIDIVSYAGTGGNEISLNATTPASRTSPYSKIADFIKAFDSSERFSDSFVPSIASGIDPEGEEILSFSFSTKFEAEPEVEIEFESDVEADVKSDVESDAELDTQSETVPR
ncbi:hypothetical protein GF354_03415 [Candidatus Peregrinibacteria bacterium]|nr:hypothetical protein [Candidatus Peregrinibacteria bacterium]